MRAMKVIVVGGTGTVGSKVSEALEARHEVIRASRRGEPRVDLADAKSIAALFTPRSDIHAVVCCAASAPLSPLTNPTFIGSTHDKLFGQVELVRHAVEYLHREARVEHWSTPAWKRSLAPPQSRCRAGSD
jgi:nucleoside-diphosphate-sugar epimerase